MPSPFKPSQDQLSRIYDAWLLSLPPLEVAAYLRLSPITVIREYVRLDDL